MKLLDLYEEGWSRVPLEGTTLETALRHLLAGLASDGVLDGAAVEETAVALATGGRGERAKITDRIVAVLASFPGLAGPKVAFGIARQPFLVSEEGDLPDVAEGLVLILTPDASSRARKELLPPLQRALKETGQAERLLGVPGPGQIRTLRLLMETDLSAPDLVEDAMVPVQYRVYPDTPLDEVLDLIVRRGVRAVPVVGDQYEVLGILTLGDALGHLLKRGSPGAQVSAGDRAPGEPLAARDVMTRTVLCVSEDQVLMDAASMMANRDVEQLPVVREGELVGFLTRASILRALHRPGRDDSPPSDDSESD